MHEIVLLSTLISTYYLSNLIDYKVYCIFLCFLDFNRFIILLVCYLHLNFIYTFKLDSHIFYIESDVSTFSFVIFSFEIIRRKANKLCTNYFSVGYTHAAHIKRG